ncbi:MAG: nucleotidyltransferase substrate binding protein [Gemmatimonadetes bacterium]|nr:nucleotidyltransferase substrate binding protein [Gemmatimonadota bacterium]
MLDSTPRWQYRFYNYRRAFFLLREAVEVMETRELSQLEKEGVIQRFEYTMELSWKVMKDYLESENVVFEQVTPRSVIRKAFEAKLVKNGDLWMEMLDARNLMSHEYELEEFEKLIEELQYNYLDEFNKLYQKLNEFYPE